MVNQHPSAHIDDGAVIGDGTNIWHGSHIMGSATIGSNCNIGQNVFIGNQVNIGNGVKIQNNTNIYEGVIIEDHVFLGPGMTFTNVINPRSEIERKDEFKTTMICEGATIGAGASIVCGTKIGTYSFVGAGAVVTKDVLPYELVVGNPARPIGWMSKVAERLRFNNEGIAMCSASNEQYRILQGKVELIS